jgi:23S rRNA (uridine2552-2'-O)-methyltransferase
MYKPNDHYAQKARKQGLKARSAFKLSEIQARHRILAKGNRVLDLGCAPGSWLQIALKIIGPTGLAVGIDIQSSAPLPPAANLKVLQGSVFEFDQISELSGLTFDVVLSDMAPSTTGIRVVDQSRSAELAKAAFEIAQNRLVRGGNFCAKVFESPEVNGLFAKMKLSFRQTFRFRPQSTRKESTEIFLVGTHFLA